MFKKILVAFDGSEGSRKALKKAIEMAFCFEAELHSISVEVDLPHYAATVGEFDEVKREKDAYFDQLNKEAIELAQAGGVTLTPHVAAGHAVDSIIYFLKQGRFDLLVTGFTGHSRIYERIWGGVSRESRAIQPMHRLD